MKQKINNKFKTAGGWNIACGLLILVPTIFAVSLTGLLAWLGIETSAGAAGWIFVILAAVFGVAFIPCLIVSVAFIAMGIALRSKKCKKGIALKIFVVLHIILKVFVVILFFTSTAYFWLIIFVVSIVYDVRVLFTRKEKLA